MSIVYVPTLDEEQSALVLPEGFVLPKGWLLFQLNLLWVMRDPESDLRVSRPARSAASFPQAELESMKAQLFERLQVAAEWEAFDDDISITHRAEGPSAETIVDFAMDQRLGARMKWSTEQPIEPGQYLVLQKLKSGEPYFGLLIVTILGAQPHYLGMLQPIEHALYACLDTQLPEAWRLLPTA